MSCSNVQIEYLGNGARVDYTFPFTYEDELEVHVAAWDETKLRFVDVERDTWEFQNATTIRFVVPPAAPEGSIGSRFIIYRETDLEEMEVTFYPGSSIRAQDLNANFEQLRDAIQEGWCRVSEEFYEYLDNYIFDTRDLVTYEDQRQGRWPQPNNVEATDHLITSGAAQAERWDTLLQDNKPADPPEGERRQGGKRWYDTTEISNYIWNDDINAWIDYSRTGPQGPKGADGHHIVITGKMAPTHRPNGDKVCNGDIWLNTCTLETYIYWNGQWITLGNAGPAGPRGPEGFTTTIIGKHEPTERPNGEALENGDIWFNTCVMETFWYYNGTWLQLGSIGPQGEKGDTGDYHTICSLKAPKFRTNGDPLECGDIWFNTCNGEAFIWYDGQWLSFGSGGSKGKDGKDGAKIWVGDKPPLNKDKYPLWYNTDCSTSNGLYTWYEAELVWVNTNTPGPKGDPGDAAAVQCPITLTGNVIGFDITCLDTLPDDNRLPPIPLQIDQPGMGFISGEAYTMYLDNTENSAGGLVRVVSTPITAYQDLDPDPIEENLWPSAGGEVISGDLLGTTFIPYGDIQSGDVVNLRTRPNAPQSEWAIFKPF
jgi:hypothetical protein